MSAAFWFGTPAKCLVGGVVLVGIAGCSGLANLSGSDNDRSLVTLDRRSGATIRTARDGTRIVTQAGQPSGSLNSILDYGVSPSLGSGSLPVDEALARRKVTLDFVQTDVREFARVLFSELLQRPYVVDQKISGDVTLRSGGEVDGNAAVAMASRALEASGNSLTISEGVYRISSALSGSRNAGGSIKTYPLAHIDGVTAQTALASLVGESGQIVSAERNSLTLRADTETLALVDVLLESIDIDRFKSSSFGLLTLKNAHPTSVATELKTLFAGAGVSQQTILPIDRMSAVLVIANKPEYLEFASKWVERLDRGREDARQIHVFDVKHRKAPELAALLKEVFSSAGVEGAQVLIAPAAPSGAATDQVSQAFAALGSPSERPNEESIRITADPDSNSLVVWATPPQHRLIEAALQRLDTPLKQVFVEATIAEVRLNGQLSHGVRWFFESGQWGLGITDSTTGAVASDYPGFNFSFQVPSAQIVISALESFTDVRIVSSPQLTVVDRESATIQVGDQVPIATKSVQEGGPRSGVVTNDITFRDTGVILKITPEIRQSGEVLLNIDQEVSRVVPTTSSNINSPTISQRKITSTVLVPDGTAIVLGGLMNSSEEQGGGGLPGTPKTLLGALFGSEKSSNARSELIVIVRPHILQNADDLREVVEEIASKMKGVLAVR